MAHDKLLAKIAPSLLITTTSGLDKADAPLLQAAKNNNIPTFTFIASWDNVWKMERLARQNLPLVLADHLATWNTMMRDHILRVFPSHPKEKISVIGAPRLDYFFHTSRIPSAEKLRDALDLPHDDKKIIHFGTTELYSLDYIVSSIDDALRTKKISTPSHLYASVHPGGDMSRHQNYAKKYNVKIKYSFGRRENSPHPNFRYNPSLEDIYMLVAVFKHTHLLINHSSTVAIESLLADVPVINVRYGRPLDWWRWYRSMVYRDFHQHYGDLVSDSATKVVKNKRDLIAAANTYLHDPRQDHVSRQTTLKKMITAVDGTASQKMFNLLKNQVTLQ
jgi:CDP-glycerol glycerophosphotransferase (TagB/SpsB family)